MTTIILTHENADFDAVGSQLAASKLYATSIPVLSRRVNRNVYGFLTEYRTQLPFIAADQWKRQHIERLIVVDSQTFTALKGLQASTPTQFIDHHPLAKSTESYQTYIGEPLGATVTLLTERIREANISLEPLEATLMMLGIYDDTGSLTYSTTTTRDLYAVAWLHEQGGMLDVLRKHLERPLNAQQRELYMQLMDHVETVDCYGSPVVIATAEPNQVVEEISVLAHRIRGMFDGEAVFLLVAMDDYVQMVARSAIDALDVGKITKAFGGGGHSKAAAAQIRNKTLVEVKVQLTQLLGGI